MIKLALNFHYSTCNNDSGSFLIQGTVMKDKNKSIHGKAAAKHKRLYTRNQVKIQDISSSLEPHFLPEKKKKIRS